MNELKMNCMGRDVVCGSFVGVTGHREFPPFFLPHLLD